MNARRPAWPWFLFVLAMVSTCALQLLACPSNDEVKREPDDGAGSKTGEAETDAPKPSV